MSKITVTYSSGRKTVTENGKTTEYDPSGKQVIRVYKTGTNKSGSVKTYKELNSSERTLANASMSMELAKEAQDNKALTLGTATQNVPLKGTSSQNPQTPYEAYVTQQYGGDTNGRNSGVPSRASVRIPSQYSPLDSRNLENSRSDKGETTQGRPFQAGFIEGLSGSPVGVVSPQPYELTPSKKLSAKGVKEDVGLGDGLLSGPGYRMLSFGAGAIESATFPFRKPKAFAKGVFYTVTNPVEAGKQVIRDVGEADPGTIGGYVGGTLGPGLIFNKIVKVGKNAYVRVGSEELPAGTVFDVSGEKVSTTKGSGAVVDAFEKTRLTNEKADIQVVHTSPKAISGEQVGAGPKAAAGLEDPGLYTSPAGSGNPQFAFGGGYGGFSLNPIKAFEGTFGVPTGSRFSAGTLVRPPENVLKSPGFEAVGKWQESIADTGKVSLTKRGLIGQGDVKSQKFTVKQDVDTPGGLSVKAGDVRFEAGTSEIEAVVPKGSTIYRSYVPENFWQRVKGFKYYETVPGYGKAAVRDYQVLDAGKGVVDGITGSGQNLNPVPKPVVSSVAKTRPSYVNLMSTYVEPSVSENADIFTVIAVSDAEVINERYADPSEPVGSPTSVATYTATPVSEVVSDSSPTTSIVSGGSSSGGSSAIVSEAPVSEAPVSESPSSPIDSSPIVSAPSSSMVGFSPRGFSPKPVSPRGTSFFKSRPFMASLNPVFKGFSEKKRSGGMFTVFGRIKGKFERLADVSSLEEGASIGKRFVETTTAASFKVTTGDSASEGLSLGGLAGFTRLSKRGRGVYVEPNKFRINTFGESSGLKKGKRRGLRL